MLQRHIGFVRPAFSARSALCATARIQSTPLLLAAGPSSLVATNIAPAVSFHGACRRTSKEPWEESRFQRIDRPDMHLRPERPTIRQLLRAGRLLVEDKVRSIGRTVQQKFLRRIFRRTPLHYISWTLYLVLLVPGFYFFIYKHYLLIEEQFSIYPKPIAEHLRNALYYGTYAAAQHQNHDKTLQHYRSALELCPQHGLDPLSDEVLGIKVRIVEWMMKGAGNYESAIATLESTLGECLRGVADMDRKLGRALDIEAQAKAIDAGLEGQVSAATIMSDISNLSVGEDNKPDASKAGGDAPNGNKPEMGSPTATPAPIPADPVPEENLWHRRRRLLHKAIQICLSLGWMFSDEHVLQPRKAQISVSWAFEATMKELLRRRSEGVKEGEGDWLTPDEIGALLEQLGHQHEEKSRFHLSIPLFFHAQRLCQEPCHRATLMNNLATSFAQHPGHAPFQLIPEAFTSAIGGGGAPVEVPSTRPEFLETAHRWAANAFSQASSVRGEARSGECDEACAAALCNLGDILVMMGKPGEALKQFTAARNIGLKTGQRSAAQLARQRMKELESKV